MAAETCPSAVTAEIRPQRAQDQLWRWQERILPYTIGSILVMAVFFFVAIASG